MLMLAERGDVVDVITLTEHLKLRGKLDAVGGAAYLAELAQAVPTAANIKYYCRLIHDKALLRTLLETSTEMIIRGYEDPSSVDDLLDQAERSILSLMEGKTAKSFAFSPMRIVLSSLS
jgi:replicative DNA helicase